MRGFGWLPDYSDHRDLDAARFLARLEGEPPDEWSNKDLVPDILDQGADGTCVANALAYAVRAAQYRDSGTLQPILSRKFLYWASRRMHGGEHVDGGTYIRSAIKALHRVGVPRESVFPYVEPVNETPTMRAINAAYDQRLGGVYRRITTTGYARVQDVKKALVMRNLVVCGTTVNQAFTQLDSDRIVGPMADSPVGGHAMAIIGYHGDVFHWVNSWGYEWGAGGFFYSSADLVAWPETRDLWIIECAPQYS